MGAKTWMLVYSDRSARDALKAKPQLDHDATLQLVQTLFPRQVLRLSGECTLADTSPPWREVRAGCFPGVSVVAAQEFSLNVPSKLPQSYIEAGGPGVVTLHTMMSVIDGFAFAQWRDGKLIRSLSLTPDTRVEEDIGVKFNFEAPFWDGRRPVELEEGESEYPLPFHPLELGGAALLELFGFQLEGDQTGVLFDPEEIKLLRFTRSAGWRFWRKWL